MSIVGEFWPSKTSVPVPGQAAYRDWGAVNYFYILPALLLFVGILVLPMLQSAYFSFLNWDGLKPAIWVGPQNYQNLFSDPDFWDSLKVTFIWVGLSGGILPVTALILFYNPLMGVINNLAMAFGVLSTLDLLGNSKTTVIAIFAVAVWQWSGFGMVIFCAALQSLPSELLDAARIDGAGKLRTIRYVVIPLLIPHLSCCNDNQYQRWLQGL